MKTNAGNLKKGEFVYYQNEIWQIQKADFYSPGKGSALMKTRIKNLVSGKNIEYNYKSSESVEVLEVSSIEMQYLYKDNENSYFISTIEQLKSNWFKNDVLTVGICGATSTPMWLMEEAAGAIKKFSELNKI